ncbi:pancreatic secretory granule membrane major glycoprotein GP2-like [Ascaphus truei]|uniref:pancreatic secretory granule membrane major glycoprotein GP2-like n=1 Tax=Ascaphus truei TaxID=8439 RepID=UPI003F5A6972
MKFLCMFLLAALLKEAGAAGCYAGTDHPMCSASTCAGYCTADNGCSCNDDVTLCVPTTQCTTAPALCCPEGFHWDPSSSCCSDKVVSPTDVVHCSPLCSSDEVCVYKSGVATCVCDNSTYRNKTIADLAPSVTCDSSVMIVSVSKCLLDALGYDYSSFQLNDKSDSCNVTYSDVINNKRVHSIEVLARTGSCGNVVSSDSSKVNYTNTLHIGNKNSPFVTKNPINYNFTCSYNLTMQTSLNFSANAVSSSVNITADGVGSVPVTMAAYKDQGYTIPIQDTDTVIVGSDLYLGLFTQFVDGEKFALRVEQCFASPINDPNYVNKVPLVTGGCPANQGVYTEVNVNGAGLEARIKISSFTFQDQTKLFIFCDVRLCDKTGTCTGCNVGRAAGADTSQVGISLSLEGDNSYSSSGSHRAVSWAVLAASLLGPLCTKLF